MLKKYFSLLKRLFTSLPDSVQQGPRPVQDCVHEELRHERRNRTEEGYPAQEGEKETNKII